ncbi:MAG: nucleoside hydrolase [Verrucomicrobiota bacterium]|nr:nucleoside hydrolase [Verrucomicrobiota bacterium]
MSHRPSRPSKPNIGRTPWLLVCVSAFLLLQTADAMVVWIDTDPAIGAPWREVDDAFALVYAFHSPDIQIAGISTSYGNAPLKRTTAVASEMVRRFAPAPVVVSPGARTAADLGKATAADEALARALRKERLTYFALGPLTNLATFARLHPGLVRQIECVIFVGGQSSRDSLRLGRGAWPKMHDANVLKDPASVAEVLAAGWPITLAPPEIAAQLSITRHDMNELANSGPAGVFLRRGSAAWLWFWCDLIGRDGGPVFDVLPLVSLGNPKLVKLRAGFAALDGELFFSRQPRPGARKITFYAAVKAEAKQRMLERLRR